MTEARLVVIAGLVAMAVLSMGIGLLWRRFTLTSLAAVALLALLWLLAAFAHQSDWHDADGWIDCWPRCTFLQDAVGAILVFAPGLVACILVIMAVARAVVGIRRG